MAVRAGRTVDDRLVAGTVPTAEQAERLAERLDDLAAAVRRAEDRNADGDPARAGSLLVPVLADLAVLPGCPAVDRVMARALVEAAKSAFEVAGSAQAPLAALDALVVRAAAGDGTGWRGLVPAVEGLRGLLALRAGDEPAALTHLDRAVASIADAEPLDACRALLNRGVLHARRHEVAAARADYLECMRLAAAGGLERLRGRAEFNLGHLEYVAGRLPAALAAMDAAAATMTPTPPTVLMDRARVLIEAGLIGVADATLARAAEQLAARRMPREVAECEMARAECAILRVDLPAARRLARAAAQRARRRGDETAWVRATVLDLQAGAAALAGTAATARQWAALGRRASRLEQLCASTDRSSWATVATYVRLESELARGVCRAPAALLATLGPVRAADPLPVRLYGRRIRALLALTAGDRERAARQIWAGQRDLRLHRARFGSLDLRTAGAVHGVALADLDLRTALSTGRPAAVLDAIERGRAAIAGSPRVNPPDDPQTADLVAALRRTLDVRVDLAQRPRSDPELSAVLREATRLKHEILARSWWEPGQVAADRAGRAARVATALDDRPQTVLVDLVELDGDLVAVRAQGAHCRLVRLGPGASAAEAVRRLQADLDVTANALVPPSLRQVARKAARHALARLDALLAPALADTDDLVVVAGGWLGALPWSLLPSRVGRATVLAPSVGHWLAHAGRPLGTAVTVGAGPGLRHAETEARAVAAAWPAARVLIGADADVASARAALSAPGLVHLAAHGRHEPDNPLFSSVRLADGPLFAHELDVGGSRPDLVVLSCCEVGRTSVRAGGESLGMANVLLRTGVGAVVAATARLSDEAAGAVMPALHARLAAGEPVAAALSAVTAARSDATDELLPLICLGASR